VAPILIEFVNTERLQSFIFAPSRLARLAIVTHLGARLKFEAAANGGLIFFQGARLDDAGLASFALL
jgi:hypothetical protein